MRKRIPVHVPPRHKYCHSCKNVIHVTRFYRNRRTNDGLTSQCKECHKASVRASRNIRKLVEDTVKAMDKRAALAVLEPSEPSYPPMSRAHL